MAPAVLPKAPAALLKPKALPCMLQEILDEFRTPDKVQFDPFLPKAPTKAHANLPYSFLSQPHPINYLNLFLTDDLWKTITTNTNQYTTFQ